MEQELLKQQSKLVEEISNSKKTIEELKSFILSICKALSLRSPQLSDLTLAEYYRIIGEDNSQEKNTETKSSTETGQDSL